MVEGQARLVEPHLQHPRLIGDLHSAASENKRTLWHSRLPPIRSTTERHYPVPADPALAVAPQSSSHARTGAKRIIVAAEHRHRPGLRPSLARLICAAGTYLAALAVPIVTGDVRWRPKQDLSTLSRDDQWFSPQLLVWAAYRDTVARIFGEFADRRSIQHLADPIPADPEPKEEVRRPLRLQRRGAAGGAPFWVDFAADIGDGFDSTYADRLLAGRRQALRQRAGQRRHRGHQGPARGQELPHGRLLIFGGDQVYPWPTREAYDSRPSSPTRWRCRAASRPRRRLPPASRHVFAIPGNHDWYDGLNAFDDQFCRARAGRSRAGGRAIRRFGDAVSIAARLRSSCRTTGGSGAPTSSSTMCSTPASSTISRTVAERMGQDDKFILCTAEPSWYRSAPPRSNWRASNLNGAHRGADPAAGAKLLRHLLGRLAPLRRYNESERSAT